LSDTQTEPANPQSAVDLTTCEREPIRIPGSIQPHGVLLVLSEQDLRVIQASENVAEVFGRPLERMLGSTLADLIGPLEGAEFSSELRASPQAERPALLRLLRLPVADGEKTFEAIAHRTAAGVVLELEAAAPPDSPMGLYPHVDAFADRAERANSVGELSRFASEEIRRLTGFDRVLIYQFDETWNGIVVGEDGNGRLPSLLDHRFPAFDIPAQARELYRVNRLRLIPDAGYRPVPLIPAENPVTRAPLDMTFSVLRSVSPIHVEYMRNMETAASMSNPVPRSPTGARCRMRGRYRDLARPGRTTGSTVR